MSDYRLSKYAERDLTEIARYINKKSVVKRCENTTQLALATPK